jgi:very-short-patch-repair endonuclease
MPIDSFAIARWCADLGGVARTSDLAAAGVDAYSIQRAVRERAITRLREGVYADADAPEPVRLAVAHGGVLGCLSRARAAGLWVLTDDVRVHVAMPRNGRRRPHDECECVIHWTRSSGRGAMATLIEALAQVLKCRGEEEFFVCLESAMRKRLIARRDLARLRESVPVARRWLIDFARWNADSGLESLLRLRLRRHGIVLASQVRVPGVGMVDFVLGDRVILEVDGKPNHVDGFEFPADADADAARKAAASKRHKDLVRDAVSASHGFDTLRFDYALIVHDWPLVEAAILAKLDHGLHLRSRAAGRSR